MWIHNSIDPGCWFRFKQCFEYALYIDVQDKHEGFLFRLYTKLHIILGAKYNFVKLTKIFCERHQLYCPTK